jgi:hypothetical protein
MEPRFNHDFGRVRVRTDEQMTKAHGAIAITEGEEITFAPGKYRPNSPPGWALLAHELAHVVQLSGHRSSTSPTGAPTSVPGEPAERAADAAARAFGGRSEPHGSVALDIRDRLQATRLRSPRVLRLATWAGDYTTDSYTTTKDGAGNPIGVDIVLRFKPNKDVDATHIGMVQMVTSRDLGKTLAVDPTVGARSIPAGKAGEGAHIDQDKGHANPLYVAGAAGVKDTLADTPPDLGRGVGGYGQYGWHFTDKAGKLRTKDATLKDKPDIPGHGADASQIFETTALAVAGVQRGTYYGSVRWGWRTDAANKFTRLALSVVSNDVPSATFVRAARQWAATPTSGGAKAIPLPSTRGKFASTATSLVADPNNVAGTTIGPLDKNTRLEQTQLGTTLPFNKGAADPWRKVTVVDGTLVGRVGWVLSSALSDVKK